MARQGLVVLFTVVAFGFLVPWYRGFTFLDPKMIVAYACLSVLFVAPASAEAFGSNWPHLAPSERLGKMALVIAYGWGIAVVTLATALATVNLTNWHGAIIAPAFALCSATLLLGLTGSLFVATLCAALTRRLSAKAVKNILRLGFLSVLLLFAFGSRFLPQAWQYKLAEQTSSSAITHLAWSASAIFTILAVLLLIPLLRKPPETP